MTPKPEIVEEAEHIVVFYRKTYPRTHWAEGEITLAKKIEGLSGGVEVRGLGQEAESLYREVIGIANENLR